MDAPRVTTGRRRWVMLAVGTLAQAATSTFLYGMPMLVPALRARDGVSLFGATLIVSAPMVGLLLTLVVWGALADRHGERIVIVTGVAGSAVLLAVATAVHGAVSLALLLVLAGACGASVNAASGRMVMGWFATYRRGLAMGIRQTAQPLGVALAGLVLPWLARTHGPHVALWFPAVFCGALALAVLVLVVDPPRADHSSADGHPPASPYRGSRALLRVHCSSALLVVPQFVIATFTVAYLVGERSWQPVAAGRLVFAFQAAGAVGRVLSGVWSDAVRSRLRPMRQLAVASAAIMLLLALGAWWHSWIVLLAFGLGAVVTVADNGLGYTAVAELAGSAWSGRALGLQNTVQNVAAVLTGPLLAVVIGQSRYGLAFAISMVFPLVAIRLTPVAAEMVSRSGARSAASATADRVAEPHAPRPSD